MTPDDVYAAVRALVPDIEKRGDEIQALRRLPADLVESLRAAGAFSMAQPRALGGPEMSPRQQNEIVELLSIADASVGWCVMIGADSPYVAALLPEQGARDLYPTIDLVTAGLAQPAGQATPVDGGYRVNGRWAFGSGCNHADVMLGGCLVMVDGAPRPQANGMPEWRIIVAPVSSFEILDTWYTTGLAGSGSTDYATTDLFVPEHHTFTFWDTERSRPEPLYRFAGTFLANMPGVPLGIARKAIDTVKAMAPGKLVVPEMQMMKDLRRVRSAVAHAEAALGAARAYVNEALERLGTGEPVGLDDRHALTLSRVHAFRAGRDITQAMVDTAGASAVYATSPLERLLRDASTLSQHIVAQERVYEQVGGVLLGEPQEFPLY